MVREFWARQDVARSLQPSGRLSTPGPAQRGSNEVGGPEAGITPDFEQAWRRWLHDGVVPNTAYPPKSVSVGTNVPPRPAASTSLEIVFKNDPTVLDGRFANNGWLQFPNLSRSWHGTTRCSSARQPLSASVSASNRRSKGASTDRSSARSSSCGIGDVRSAALCSQSPGIQTAPRRSTWGGRTRAGHLGTGAGFNANAIRTSDGMWFAGGLRGRRHWDHVLPRLHAIPPSDGRARHGAGSRARRLRPRSEISMAESKPCRAPSLCTRGQIRRLQVGHGNRHQCLQWLQCCVVGCQAENNIPVVGKDQVASRPRDAGCASTPITVAHQKTLRHISSRFRACTAKTHHAKSSVRSARRCTAPRG